MRAKIVAIVLSLASGLGANAQFTFTTNNGALTITGYTVYFSTVIIPAITNGYPVTGIGDSAFNGQTEIRSIILSTNITTIGNQAFNNTDLTNIYFPASITNLGNLAFVNCAFLTNITVDPGNPVYSSTNGVLFDKAQTTLVEFPFGLGYNHGLGAGFGASYTVPASVTAIGQNAFFGCSLTNVTMLNSVVSIGGAAFEACYSLTNVIMSTGLTSIGTNAFYNCYGLTNVSIPNSVTNIGANAFYNCTKLTSMTLPNSITKIGSSAFTGCTSLTNVVLPANLASMANYMFQDCYKLTSLTIPNSVTNIGTEALYGCSSLANVIISTSVKNIGDGAFYHCTALAAITLPGSVSSLGNFVFNGCTSLTNLTCLGNAPSLGVNTLQSVPGIVFYYYGTSGWGSTYGGLPTVELGAPSSPPEIGGGGNIKIQAGNFSFLVTGNSNQTVVVEASTNFMNWQTVWTNTLTSTNTIFNDPQWTNYPYRYYRAR